MRQTLFYIPPEILGFPVFGFGIAFVLLAVVVLVAAGIRFVRTKKFDEDIWSYLGLLVVGGVILVFIAPNVMEPEGFPIRGYGVCLLVAILSALALALQLLKRKGVPSEQVFSLCLWAVVSGLLGTRLFYVVEYWPQMAVYDSGALQIDKTFFNIVNIAQGGLVVFGGILGGALGSFIFMIRNKMPVLSTFDSMAPAMMLGLSIGRLGCLMNGCCFGGPTDVCWGITFPVGSPAHLHQVAHGETFYYGLKFEESHSGDRSEVVISAIQPGTAAERSGIKPGWVLRGIGGMHRGKPVSGETHAIIDVLELLHGFQRETPGEALRFDIFTDPARTETKSYFLEPEKPVVLPVHPTQIYSSIGAATLCVVLLLLGRLEFFRRRDGMIFAAFMFLYSTMRFGIEMIRTDEDSFLGTGLTVSQNVSIGVFLAGCLLTVFILRRSSIDR